MNGKEFRIINMEYNPKVGMFAAANQVMAQLYMFEKGLLPDVAGLEVDFGHYGLYYDPQYGLNWWSYYFEPICLGDKKNLSLVFPTREQYSEAWTHRRNITRETAAQVVSKYIRIKPHLRGKIEAFIDRHFVGYYVIGIHYRGTDKASEAPKVSYETVFTEIEKQIPLDKPYVIFVATDEVDFLEQAKHLYPGQIVAIDAHRSENHVGIHFAHKNNYCVGEEALMDAYLLSRCDLLIRTSSNLSLWSTYFNPDLPVILLNHRFMETIEPE